MGKETLLGRIEAAGRSACNIVRRCNHNSQIFGHSAALEAHTDHYRKETVRARMSTASAPSVPVQKGYVAEILKDSLARYPVFYYVMITFSVYCNCNMSVISNTVNLEMISIKCVM